MKKLAIASLLLLATTAHAVTLIDDTHDQSVGGHKTFTGTVDLNGPTTLQSPTLTTPTITSPTITGGTINNTTVGLTTPAAGQFTTVKSCTGPVIDVTCSTYGAVGDGVADDGPAFQLAHDAASAIGATILLPPPTVSYRIATTVTVTKPIRWLGGALGGTAPAGLITKAVNGPVFDVVGDQVTERGLSFENIKFVGTAGKTGTAITVTSATYVTIRNVQFRSIDETALKLVSTRDSFFENVFVEEAGNSTNPSVVLDSIASPSGNGNDRSIFMDLHVENSTAHDAIQLDLVGNATNSVTAVECYGCKFHGATDGAGGPNRPLVRVSAYASQTLIFGGQIIGGIGSSQLEVANSRNTFNGITFGALGSTYPARAIQAIAGPNNFTDLQLPNSGSYTTAALRFDSGADNSTVINPRFGSGGTPISDAATGTTILYRDTTSGTYKISVGDNVHFPQAIQLDNGRIFAPGSGSNGHLVPSASSTDMTFSLNELTETITGTKTFRSLTAIGTAVGTGAPANTGSTRVGDMRVGDASGIMFDMGTINVSPFPFWLQVHDSVNQAVNYPLLLQPNGGGVSIGKAGTALGTMDLEGSTSGTITIQPQAAAGTYNFNLPTTAGSAGQPLLSGGGAAAAQTYGTLGSTYGGTGAALNGAPSGTYPKSNGGTPAVYAASTLAAAGTGACTNQVVTATNGDAVPTCSSLTQAMATSGFHLSTLMGSCGTTNLSNAAANYFPLSGIAAPSATEADVRTVAPVAGTIAKLACLLTAAPTGATLSYTLAVRVNTTTTAVTCTITDTATTCTDAAHSVAVAAGDTIDVIATPANTPTASAARCSVEMQI